MPGLGTGAELALIALTAALTAGGETSGLCRLMMDAAANGLGDVPVADLARLAAGALMPRLFAVAALNRTCAGCMLCDRGRGETAGAVTDLVAAAVTPFPPPAGSHAA